MSAWSFLKGKKKALSTVSNGRGGWLPILRESYSGAWQQNVEVDNDTALTYFAVFSCMTLIASDIAKLPLTIRRREGKIWSFVPASPFSALLQKPNTFQNRIQFWENYMLSKLSCGNVYVLKSRGPKGAVDGLYILDPARVQVLVSPSGAVFYQLQRDDISGIESMVTVPSSEIIHDRMNCLFHPLVGLSPLVSAGLAAMQGFNIQNDAATFFANRGIPGGILTAPGAISDETAERLRDNWTTKFAGAGKGGVAVAGDGLKFEPMRMTAIDAQVIDQLRWSAEVVCSVFHVPPYKIGIGQTPSYNNVQALNVEYYSQALQILLESAEITLMQGIDMPPDLEPHFDIRALLRMDSMSQINRIKEGVGAGVLSPNEGREELNLPPVQGGQTPYLQQQNYSLSALDERDRRGLLVPATPPAPATPTALSLSALEMDRVLEETE